MKNMEVNLKVFYALLVASVFSSFAVFPYLMSLDRQPVSDLSLAPPTLLILQLVVLAVIHGVFIYAGLALSKATGLGAPRITALTEGKTLKEAVGPFWVMALVWGVVLALVVVILELVFLLGFDVSIIQNVSDVPVGERFLATFYGAVNEEVMLRLFLVTLFAWIGMTAGKAKKLSATTMWVAIVLVAVLFGLGSLSSLGAITALTPIVVLRVVLIHLVEGSIFGYIYWKQGLLSAMIAHFAMDLTLFVVLPYILQLV